MSSMPPEIPPPNPPNLFALLVGIDAYPTRLPAVPVTFPALTGGVRDARRLADYLSREPAFALHPVVLLNAEATKKAIAQSFRQHLGRAKAGDVALFYFSGHGTQETAEPGGWESETDGRLECLVCHPGTDSKTSFLLADKELRYLLHAVARTGAHVVTIFDCCHAGDVTRAGRRAEFGRAVEKRLDYVFPARPWADFLFAETHDANEIREKGDLLALPEGRHVRLSACQPGQSAWEFGGEGVFTKTLLHLLNATGGQVSYHDLDRRAGLSLRSGYDQNPQAYAAGDADPTAALLRTFLGKPGDSRRAAYGEVIFNPQTAWTLNLGALHGLTTESEVSVRIQESPPTWRLAPVHSVDMATAQVSWPDPAQAPDLDRAYPAQVRGLLAHPLHLFVEAPEGPWAVVQGLFNEAETQGYLTPVPDESGANYVLRLRPTQAYFTAANDPHRPLLAPMRLDQPDSASALRATLRQISHWEFLRNLTNFSPDSLAPNPMDVDVWQAEADGEFRPVPIQNGGITIGFREIGGSWQNRLRIRLGNSTAQPLYVAALYLQAGFGVFTGFLNPAVCALGPGERVFLREPNQPTQNLTLQLDDFVLAYGWPRLTEHLLLIVSTDFFSVEGLALEPLPLPPTANGFRSGTPVPTPKGIGYQQPNQPGWTTQVLTIQQPNPLK